MSNILKLSEEEEQRIVDLYQSGVSKHKLYKDYNIPYSVAGRILDKHGIMHRTETQKKIDEMSNEEKALIIKLYKEFMPIHKLAKKVGHSSDLCKTVLKDSGVSIVQEQPKHIFAITAERTRRVGAVVHMNARSINSRREEKENEI